MKKYTGIILTIAVTTMVANAAFADGSAFTPLNFDDSSYSAPKTAPEAPKATTSSPFSNALSKIMPSKKAPAVENATGENPVGNENIQNAILELDNAQVGIRNELVDYKAKYADADAQYKLIKNERAMLHRQVVSVERRIRSIDRTKEKMRKNML